MSFASLSQNKKESHWHYLLRIFSWAYSSWRKEKMLLSWVWRQERVFCALYSNLKQTSLWILWPRGKKKKALVSGESKWIPGSNQEKNAWGIRRTLWCRINFWWGFSLQHCPEFYAKHQGTLVNWKVTWVIVGLRPYSNDEVRGKKHTGLLSEEERKWRKKRFVEWARGWRKEFVSGRMMIHSEKIKHPFPLQRRGQNLV